MTHKESTTSGFYVRKIQGSKNRCLIWNHSNRFPNILPSGRTSRFPCPWKKQRKTFVKRLSISWETTQTSWKRSLSDLRLFAQSCHHRPFNALESNLGRRTSSCVSHYDPIIVLCYK